MNVLSIKVGFYLKLEPAFYSAIAWLIYQFAL